MKHVNQIIKGIQITEKGTELSSQHKYLIEVDRDANKIEIKQAVETFFNVTVLAVNTQRYKGKSHTLRNRRVVNKPDWKRAIVTLKEGDKIDII